MLNTGMQSTSLHLLIFSVRLCGHITAQYRNVVVCSGLLLLMDETLLDPLKVQRATSPTEKALWRVLVNLLEGFFFLVRIMRFIV